MKKYIHKISLIAVTLVITMFLHSCSDKFFEKNPGDTILPEKHFKTKQDLVNSINGIYTFLQDGMPDLVLIDGLRSDLMEVTENFDAALSSIYYQDLSTENLHIDPSFFYKAIININFILPKVQEVAKLDWDFKEKDSQSTEKFLIALRSWCYFTLCKIYGETIVFPINHEEINPSIPTKRIDKAAMIDTLINQLLPYDSDDLLLFIPFYSALLGELYLEKLEYQNAVKHLKMAVDPLEIPWPNLKLNQEFEKKKWKNIFDDSESRGSEVILAVSYNYEHNQINPIELYMNPAFGYKVRPVKSLIELYEQQLNAKNVLSGDENRGLNITYGLLPDSSYYINKYSLYTGITPFKSHIIIRRAADIHLMLAEAYNRLNDQAIALRLLNEGFSRPPRPAGFGVWSPNLGVRGRVGLNSLKVPDGVPNPVEYVEDLIIQERAMELAFEGKRFFDLMRIANRRNDPAYLADRVAAKYSDPAVREAVREKLMNKENWYLPLKKLQLD